MNTKNLFTLFVSKRFCPKRSGMRNSYPSDISREQFDSIQALLEQAKKKTKPRVVDLYEVFCAILYVLKSGCQWRMLPRDFPSWQVVYKYFRHWSQKPSDEAFSLLEQAVKNVVGAVRINRGRNEQTRFVIVDAQSLKNTDTAEQKGYDVGKRVSGIKRHLAVDTHLALFLKRS